MKFALVIIFILALVGYSHADSLADLASPSQAIRDSAAKEIRTTFQPTPESKWTPIIDKIEKGQSKTDILELLRPYNVSEQGELAGGGSYSESYRLDNEWVLTCWYINKSDTLIERRLNHKMKHIWVKPPEQYSGKWIVYFANGQISHELNYKDGKYFGELRANRSDGSLCVLQHSTETGANGADIGYHPSGKVAYRGTYKDGQRVGTWTWYDENGNVTSTQDLSGP
jgi:antitoxin component YwqK of YwqJK toxin-antitoxin module